MLIICTVDDSVGAVTTHCVWCVCVGGRMLQKAEVSWVGGGGGDGKREITILYNCLENLGDAFKVYMVLFLYYWDF